MQEWLWDIGGLHITHLLPAEAAAAAGLQWAHHHCQPAAGGMMQLGTAQPVGIAAASQPEGPGWGDWGSSCTYIAYNSAC